MQSVAVASSYQGSWGRGNHQYYMCNDHHRPSPAVNKMIKKKLLNSDNLPTEPLGCWRKWPCLLYVKTAQPVAHHQGITGDVAIADHHDNGDAHPAYDPHPALTRLLPRPHAPNPRVLTHIDRSPAPSRVTTTPLPFACHLAPLHAALPPPLRSMRRHRCTLHAAGHSSLHPTAAPTIYVPPLSHSRHPCPPPFAAMHPTPVPLHFGPHHRIPMCPHTQTAPCPPLSSCAHHQWRSRPTPMLPSVYSRTLCLH